MTKRVSSKKKPSTKASSSAYMAVGWSPSYGEWIVSDTFATKKAALDNLYDGPHTKLFVLELPKEKIEQPKVDSVQVLKVNFDG